MTGAGLYRNAAVSLRAVEADVRAPGAIHNSVPSSRDVYLHDILKLHPMLCAYLSRMTRNASEVPDLVQETYFRLFRCLRDGEINIQRLRPFAIQTARNIGIDWIRRRDSQVVDFVGDPECIEVIDPGACVEAIAIAEEELNRLAGIVESLPKRCARAFTLRKVYGYSQKEIAARLQISENTVEQHLSKAARRCAEALFESPGGAIEDNRVFAGFRQRKKRNSVLQVGSLSGSRR